LNHVSLCYIYFWYIQFIIFIFLWAHIHIIYHTHHISHLYHTFIHFYTFSDHFIHYYRIHCICTFTDSLFLLYIIFNRLFSLSTWFLLTIQFFNIHVNSFIHTTDSYTSYTYIFTSYSYLSLLIPFVSLILYILHIMLSSIAVYHHIHSYIFSILVLHSYITYTDISYSHILLFIRYLHIHLHSFVISFINIYIRYWPVIFFVHSVHQSYYIISHYSYSTIISLISLIYC
jgi:hypothetical protein